MAKEFQRFITYMTSIWGMLAGITSVFPLADIILKVIPLPVDAYGKSTAPVAIPITTLVALFILYYVFVQRDKIQIKTAQKAAKYFAIGLISLMVFFLLEHFEEPLRMRLFPGLDSTDDYILMLVIVVPFYVTFFAFVTRAFTILALIEFKRR